MLVVALSYLLAARYAKGVEIGFEPLGRFDGFDDSNTSGYVGT